MALIAARKPESRPGTSTTITLRWEVDVSLMPGDTDKPTGRIDWILIRDDGRRVEVRSHEILHDGDEAAGRYPSDHYPVLAELELSG